MIPIMNIIAAIVAFNPDPERLMENIGAIRNQVDKVLIFNNGNPELLPFVKDIQILDRDGSNIGIASALNMLCQQAEEAGFEWILMLDQDSVVPPNLVEEYRKYIQDERVALVSPAIQDRNYGSMSYDSGDGPACEEIEVCITSGSMLRLSAWKAIGGFWDELFIDMVDFDLCWSLHKAGFKILRVNNKVLLHEIGHARRVTLLGKDNVVYNHSPQRCYYIIRNTIAVGRKHGRQKQCRHWVLKRILLINLFESGRWTKNKMMAKGIIDGIRFKR